MDVATSHVNISEGLDFVLLPVNLISFYACNVGLHNTLGFIGVNPLKLTQTTNQKHTENKSLVNAFVNALVDAMLDAMLLLCFHLYLCYREIGNCHVTRPQKVSVNNVNDEVIEIIW